MPGQPPEPLDVVGKLAEGEHALGAGLVVVELEAGEVAGHSHSRRLLVGNRGQIVEQLPHGALQVLTRRLVFHRQLLGHEQVDPPPLSRQQPLRVLLVLAHQLAVDAEDVEELVPE